MLDSLCRHTVQCKVKEEFETDNSKGSSDQDRRKLFWEAPRAELSGKFTAWAGTLIRIRIVISSEALAGL